MKKPKTIITQLQILNYSVIIALISPVIILAICCIDWKELKQQNSLIESKTVYKIVLNFESKIPYEDSIILRSLWNPLMEKERFKGTLYQNPNDPKWYIGIGHQMKYKDFQDIFFMKFLQNVFCYSITKEEAEVLFWNDIKLAWVENERLKRKTLYKDCYNIFISGSK